MITNPSSHEHYKYIVMNQERSQIDKETPEISAVIVNYNGARTLVQTIESLLAMNEINSDIILVDDGSTDGSIDLVKSRFPNIRTLEEPQNTRDVNRLRNKGLEAARSRYVLLTDNDISFSSNSVKEMLKILQFDRRIAACTPRLMRLGNEQIVDHADSRLHYVGATISAPRETAYDETDIWPKLSSGGGISLFDMQKVAQVGGFDEGMELAWGDDGELHQRLLLSGMLCLYVPTASGTHEHKEFNTSRHYRAQGQIRNRWRLLLTHYSLRTLILITPALLLFELSQIGFYILKGLIGHYLKGTFSAIRDIKNTINRRAQIQKLRTVPDQQLIFSGPIFVGNTSSRIIEISVKSLSSILNAYWKIISPALSNKEQNSFKKIEKELRCRLEKERMHG